MSALLDVTLEHLKALVGFDTRNPPRAIDTGGIFDYLRDQLPGFELRTTDHGGGSVALHAVRGKPRLLFNVHVDTVPDSPAWTADPRTLRLAGDRAIGLGACDIKGAAAALLAVAQATDGDLALLFSSDEEGSDPRCIAGFLHSLSGGPPSPDLASSLLPSGDKSAGLPICTTNAAHRLRHTDVPNEGARRADEGSAWSGPPGAPEPSPPTPLPQGEGSYRAVIVAEPTRARAVLAHRGILSVRMGFAGRAGHASAAQGAADSALHQVVRWGDAALDFVAAHAQDRFGELEGLRFNIGVIQGGIKANMIAPSAELRFGCRPLPNIDADWLLDQFRGLCEPAPAAFAATFRGPALPAGAAAQAGERRQQAAQLAAELGLPLGQAVDFWTEAALFSAAGFTTMVYGPGDIVQAHSADEWVALDELAQYAASIHRIVDQGQA